MTEKEILVRRLTEKIEKTNRYWQTTASDFYPRELLLEAMNEVSNLDNHTYLWGGYEEANRLKAIFSMEALTLIDDTPLCLLYLRGKKEFLKATHRDYLGVLMSLGIKREKFGDIIVYDDGADIILDESIEDYVLSSPLSVKKVPLTVTKGEFSTWEKPTPKFKVLNLQLTSLRLDSVVAKVFHLSRADGAKLIEKEQVMVNYQVETKPSRTFYLDDVVSVRGYGKFKIGEGAGYTRKDKIRLTVYQYI